MTLSGSDQKGANRILPRYQYEARIKIEVTRGETRVCFEGWARDLSESGLGAFVGSELRIGEPITLRIPLPHQSDLVVPALVSRAIGTQCGFQFTALSTKQREQVRKVLARCKLAADEFEVK